MKIQDDFKKTKEYLNALDLIKYWNTLSKEKYLEEDKGLRKRTLRLVYMNWKPKPDFVKEFWKKITERFSKSNDDKQKEIEWFKRWLEKNKYDYYIIRYTDKYMLISTEEYLNWQYKYKKWFVLNIKEEPMKAKLAVKYLEHWNNEKYEVLYNKYDKFVNYVYSL